MYFVDILNSPKFKIIKIILLYRKLNISTLFTVVSLMLLIFYLQLRLVRENTETQHVTGPRMLSMRLGG